MTAEALNCPMCGAAASTEAARCEHCGARLATVACPSCFGMMFVGARYCSHCGAQANRLEVPVGTSQACPRCRLEMAAVVIGNTNLRECSGCEGIWVDTDALTQICADREQQAAVLGMAAALPEPRSAAMETVRYVPCPICKALMNRVNFARCSRVIVDVCRQHGTWFDRDELRRIVEFIRAGGMDLARTREMAALEEERRRLQAARLASGTAGGSLAGEARYDGFDVGLSAAGAALKLFIK